VTIGGRLLSYETIIVGGGIAGLQAAIQLGRYGHQVKVIDSGYGRSTLCRSYHNILGYPDGISGTELRRIGRLHAERLGIEFEEDEVIEAVVNRELFEFKGKKDPDRVYRAKTVLLATGVLDRFPDIPNLVPCLGLTVYVCPDCDGYEVRDRRTIVMGSGDTGASMALTLSYWTTDILYVNHEKKPVSEDRMKQLQSKKIAYREAEIREVMVDGKPDQGSMSGVILESGEKLLAERGFIAFGGNEVKTGIADMLGVERLENRHIITDPRSKETSVKHVWAAGDIGVHAEQVTVAMGEGSLAAIWIHKALLALHK
jgi:thioredoxin reductase (NADPH)